MCARVKTVPGSSASSASRSNSFGVSASASSASVTWWVRRSIVSGPTVSRRELVGSRLRPARHRADAGEQLAEAERLHDVVVGAELEPDDAVDLVAARRDDDDRHVRRGAEPAAHLEAVDVRQPEVEQHDVVVLRRRARLRPSRRARPRAPPARAHAPAGSAIASSSSTISTRTGTPSHRSVPAPGLRPGESWPNLGSSRVRRLERALSTVATTTRPTERRNLTMDRRKTLATAGAISLTASAAVVALGSSMGLFGLTDDSPRVGKLSPIDATQPARTDDPDGLRRRRRPRHRLRPPGHRDAASDDRRRLADATRRTARQRRPTGTTAAAATVDTTPSAIDHGDPTAVDDPPGDDGTTTTAPSSRTAIARHRARRRR